jgi:hypothetical protein
MMSLDEMQEPVFPTFLCTGWRFDTWVWQLQIKFEFRYAWPTIEWIILSVGDFVSPAVHSESLFDISNII